MVSWAHRPNEGVAREAWRDCVLDFVVALRTSGVDADLDLFHLHELGIDWSRYGPDRVQQCPRTIVVLNAAWRERLEGTNVPTEGAGAAAEADVLLGLFGDDQEDFRRRVLLVVLPGADSRDVPPRWSGLQRFVIPDFTREGLEDLLRVLTGQPAYLAPPVGTVPLLPAAMLDSASAAVQAVDGMSATSPAGVDAPLEAELRDQSAVFSAALRATADHPSLQGVAASVQTEHLAEGLHVFAEAINRLLSSSPAIQEVQRTTAAAAQKAITSSLAGSASSGGAARAASRLTELLAHVSEAVERENRCWVLLAGALEDPDAAAAMEGHDGRSVRQRRQEQVSTWISRTLPPVPLGQGLDAVRTAGRVVLSAPPAHAVSPAWRLELGDHGEVAAAANVAGAVVPGSPFDPPEDGRRQYPDLHLPVRVDPLEMWLLTQVQLAADHLSQVAADRDDASALFQARLLLPEHLAHPEAYPRRHGVRLVNEHRDDDGHPLLPLSAVAGSRDLLPGSPPPTAGPVRIRVADLSHPQAMVRLAHTLAVELLEHFAVETTSVLRSDGTLDELAAAAADQQAVWVHAVAMGLARDEVSPVQRRQRYDELLAQARAALRR